MPTRTVTPDEQIIVAHVDTTATHVGAHQAVALVHDRLLTQLDALTAGYQAALGARFPSSRAAASTAGRRRIIARHAPGDDRGRIVCTWCMPSGWPCADVADASAGLLDPPT